MRQCQRLRFQVGRHCLVPAVEESKRCDQRDDLYDLPFVVVASQVLEVLWGRGVRALSRGQGEPKRDALSIAVQVAALEVMDGSEAAILSSDTPA